METYLALASLRALRTYEDRPIPEAVLGRIVDAGRVTGSSRNAQPWTFVVIEGERLGAVAECVWEPGNLAGAAAAVAVVVGGKGPVMFDAGRAAQAMMLAAWDEGVGSCPNGVREAAALGEVLGLADGDQVATVISMGYPVPARDPSRRSAAQWLAAAKRKSLDQVVRHLMLLSVSSRGEPSVREPGADD
ncbi:MAG: nitroreductase family protein [Acidimicrobiales bacterium]